MPDRALLLAIIGVCAPLSVVSFGGGPAIIAPLQHQAVDVHHWLSDRDFVDFFAISRAAPGPGTLIAALIGYHLAGWIGAITAALALYVPSSIIVYAVAQFWKRAEGSSWRPAVERGLVPVAVGLVVAGALVIFEAGDFGPLQMLTAAVATGIFAARLAGPYTVFGVVIASYLVLAAVWPQA
jgi:chromate transporter